MQKQITKLENSHAWCTNGSPKLHDILSNYTLQEYKQNKKLG